MKLGTANTQQSDVKIVNHGNVFGTVNWYTFYCNGCGSQLIHKATKCEGSNPFVKGCGKKIDINSYKLNKK